ncbi:MAG: thymidine phosphorylase [Oscillospiraceae bacterium]|nr:thymidine phosphorylase [Oscillospiraceae bacterium]
MQIYDLIQKTRRLTPLTEREIQTLVEGFTRGEVPDYMMSAWLMAVCCQGLTTAETAALTQAMRDSGECLDLSSLGAPTVDKHSTGGIGDKTTIIVAPIVAACGGLVPKMSGRGLGYTGGTIDKFQSIPGFTVDLPHKAFMRILEEIGCCVIAQSGDLTPADKKMYALRNLTATVESIPLICSSIMCKKLALGADCILLDVKYGSGAFMKTSDEAAVLADLMVDVGKQAGRNCRALITDMNAPLGACVGNGLEVEEAIRILRGEVHGRLTELALSLAAQMLVMIGKGDIVECRQIAEDALTSGRALERLEAMITAQGGDASVTEDLSKMPHSPVQLTVRSPENGYITSIQSEEVGLASLGLGAGRTAAHQEIDPGAGVVFSRSVGDEAVKGEPLFTVYGRTEELCETAAKRIMDAITIEETPAEPVKLIYKIVE